MSTDVVRSVLVSRDHEVHTGDAVFLGTRVPVNTLIDYLKGGNTIDDFLENFPSGRRDQAMAALELLREVLQSE